MILTVTLNPLLERRFEYTSVNYGKSNRNPIEIVTAGGKGINVSRQLNHLNLPNTAFTFAGGFTGKLYKKLVHDEGINASFVQTVNETRNGSVIIDKNSNSISTFFGADTEISDSEADEFLNRLERMISNCEMLVLSGSSPATNTDKIFPEAIRIANRLNKVSLLDTYGTHLRECLDASPTIIHNNKDELNPLFDLSDEKSILNLLDLLYAKEIKQAFITNGPHPVYASNFDFHYKITFPQIDQKDPTGSGDAFSAGLLYGWHNNLTFEETAIIASSLGVLNASRYSICSSTMIDVENIRGKIKVIPVGKKMKTIDVTPQ